jgi:hypothetical protein
LIIKRNVSTALIAQRKHNNIFPEETPMADQAGLCRIGFAFSGIVAIVVVIAAATVSASMGVL